MEESKAKQTTAEELMLKSISMSIFGKNLQSRCRFITPGQRAEMEEAAIQNFMNSFNIDRDKAIEMYQRTKG
jgi:hypothetical protein